MRNVSAPKGAGKRIPRAKIQPTQAAEAIGSIAAAQEAFREDATPAAQPAYAPPRPFRVGDLVTTYGTVSLAQITAIDGDGVVLAPLVDTMPAASSDVGTRIGSKTKNLRLVPTPPLPFKDNVYPVVLAELTRGHVDDAHEIAREETAHGISVEERADQIRRFQAALNAYGLFGAIWAGLTSGDSPSIYAHGTDTLPIATVDRLNVAMSEALRPVATALQCCYDGDRSSVIADSDMPRSVPCILTAKSRSKDGKPFPIGCRVYFDNSVGRVVYVAADTLIVLIEAGDYRGKPTPVNCSEAEVIDTTCSTFDVLSLFNELNSKREGQR